MPIVISKFALGGQGLGFVDKIPVFVDDACVGDGALVRIGKKKSSFAEGRAEEILQPSSERVAARCRHFGECGGCIWQFLPYEKQLQWKERLVHETLQHIGGMGSPPLAPIRASPAPWEYRNKVEWSFARDDDGKIACGYHRRYRHYDLVHVEECFLIPDDMVAILKRARGFFEEMERRMGSHAVVYDGRTRRGLVSSIFMREGKRTGERMVILLTSREEMDEAGFVSAMLDFPSVVSVVRVIVDDMPGRAKRYEERVLFGKETYAEVLRVKMAGGDADVFASSRREDDGLGGGACDDGVTRELTFDVRPMAFFQPNPRVAELMYGEIVAMMTETFSSEALRGMRAADLYCGTGTIGIVLSSLFADIVGVEINASALEIARENAARNGCDNMRFEAMDAKKWLEGEGGGRRADGAYGVDGASDGRAKENGAGEYFDVFLVDPPRSGMETKALGLMIARAPRAVVYISCNPATFARDAKILEASGYRCARIRPFDQFPHTAHIELVSLFVRDALP